MHQQQSWLYPIIQTRENTEIQTYSDVRINTRPYLMDRADHNKEKYKKKKYAYTEIQGPMYLMHRADHNEEKEGGDALRYYRSPELQCPAKKRVKNFFKLLILI